MKAGLEARMEARLEARVKAGLEARNRNSTKRDPDSGMFGKALSRMFRFG